MLSICYHDQRITVGKTNRFKTTENRFHLLSGEE